MSDGQRRLPSYKNARSHWLMGAKNLLLGRHKRGGGLKLNLCIHVESS